MKAISALMAIALVALGGVTFHLRRELEAGRQQVAILESKVQERQPPTAASPVTTPAQTSTVADQAPQRVTSPDNRVRGAPSFALLSAQIQSPEGQARFRSILRHNLESSLPDLDQVLDLTTAEKDKLLDLLATQQLRSATPRAPEQEHESAQESEERQQREYETKVAELQALLGSKYPKWQDYEDTVSVRVEERALRVALDAAGIPLAQTQEQTLIDALVEVQRGFNQTDRTSRGVRVVRTPENCQLLLSAATPYLSVRQLDKYQAVLERRAAMYEASISRRPESGQ